MPPRKHKVIALISGGKDSLYSLLHVLALGHEIVALANLYPPPLSLKSAGVRVETGTKSEVTVHLPGEITRIPTTHDEDTHGSGEEKEEDEDEDEDPNSHMYQTAGHSLLPLYATALDLPLYRYPITGTAVSSAKAYAGPGPITDPSRSTASKETAEQSAQQDETESLIPLLKHVLARHPAASALSSGAILSSYQRTRVESVAGRLGLASLAYLWQWPVLPGAAARSSGDERRSKGAKGKMELLTAMREARIEARIVKAASGGLTAEELWMDVAASGSDALLARAMGRFNPASSAVDTAAAVIGEGGEYETLALDGPDWLFKRRIEVKQGNWSVIHGKGGVYWLSELKGKIVEKVVEGRGGERVVRPRLLDDMFMDLWRGRGKWDEVGVEDEHGREYKDCEEIEENVAFESGQKMNGLIVRDTKTSLYISIIHAGQRKLDDSQETPTSTAQRVTLKEQLVQILSSLQRTLESRGLAAANVAHSTILLRNMADFQEVNSSYGALFKAPGPPSRVTVAIGDAMPTSADISISCIVNKGSLRERNHLHVQSQSYWAPANIGPYSQGVSVPLELPEDNESPNYEISSKVVYISGQIPLVPSQMEMLNASFAESVVLGLQHLWRVGEAMNVNWWTSAVAFFTAPALPCAAATRASTLIKAWNTVHLQAFEKSQESDEDVDFDVGDAYLLRKPWDHAGDVEVKTPEWPYESGQCPPPCFAVQVSELPRMAPLEWTSVGLSLRENSVLRVDEGSCRVMNHTNANPTTFAVAYAGTHDEGDLLLAKIARESETKAGGPMIELYISRKVTLDLKRRIQGMPVTLVPCFSIWGPEGRDVLLLSRTIGT